jgi:translation initiation factor 5
VTGEKHQKSLLGGLERLLALSPNSDELLAAGITSKTLMALYQADLLDEDVVTQWGTHVSKKYVDKEKSKKVRKSADAFLKVCLGVWIRKSRAD